MHVCAPFLLGLLWAGSAAAATIDGVSADGTTVSLRLSKDEQASLKPGDTIALQPRTSAKAPVEGKITAIKDGKATVSVKQSAARTAFRSGGKVNVASAGAITPMVSTPKPAPAAPPLQPDDAFADGSQSFEDELHSFAFSDPSQLYQTRQTRTEAAATYDSESATYRVGGTRTSANAAGPMLAAAVSYPFPRTPHRVAFAIEHASRELTAKTSVSGASNTSKGTYSATSFAPGGSYAVNDNIALGAFYHVIQETYSGAVYRGHELSLSYARAELGATWHVPGLEAGLNFKPAVNEESHAVETLPASATGTGAVNTAVRASEPQTWTAHAQAQVNARVTAFGSVAFNLHNFNNVGGESSWDNNFTLQGGAEAAIGDGLSAGGMVAVDTPAYPETKFETPDNIATWRVGGDFAKALGAAGKVGAQLVYTVAADDFDQGGAKASADRDRLSLAVTGAVKM